MTIDEAMKMDPVDAASALAAEVRRLRSQVGQHTKCAVCLKDKQTPLHRDEMGGYVCLTCVEKEMGRLRERERVLMDAVEVYASKSFWKPFPALGVGLTTLAASDRGRVARAALEAVKE